MKTKIILRDLLEARRALNRAISLTLQIEEKGGFKKSKKTTIKSGLIDVNIAKLYLSRADARYKTQVKKSDRVKITYDQG